MKVVIAEKPSVARDLARVLGATTTKDGYIEGNGYLFTWAFGHLIQLAMPEDYGWDRASALPMVPREFKLKVRQKKGKVDEGAKNQLEVIEGCFKRADEIIVATDSGREGELIFRYIYDYLGCKKSFKRLWINSQTDKAIKAGFASLKKGSDYDSLYMAAKARSESDWLVGMNATRALSRAAQSNGTYSIGRVQTPTLVMICERYIQFKNFVPEIYYQLEIDLVKKGIKFTATSEKKWKSKEEAAQVLAAVKKRSPVVVNDIEKKEKSEAAPLFYDLTSLQKDANKKFGFSAGKTLEIAQALYEKKFITYPRTGSRYVGDDVFEEIPSLVKLLTSYERFKESAQALQGKELNKRSLNASKVSDHHALLPTENVPKNLSDQEKEIYELIAGRMLEGVSENCVKEITTVWLDVYEKFIAQGVVIKRAGWRSVFMDKEEDDDDKALPELVKSEQVAMSEARNVRKQTKPKPLHTEGTLLEAMETCGRDIEDEAAREAMKESGIGTPATRSDVIEKLFEREYIRFSAKGKKSLVPTSKGEAVYQLVKDMAIGQPVMTGDWEKMLSQIESKKVQPDFFMNGIVSYTVNLTNEFLKSGNTIKQTLMENSEVCPKCGQGHVRFNDYGMGCDRDTKDNKPCGFWVWRTIAKAKMTDDDLMELLKNKTTKREIRGMEGKNGKFDSKIIMKPDFTLGFPAREKKA